VVERILVEHGKMKKANEIPSAASYYKDRIDAGGKSRRAASARAVQLSDAQSMSILQALRDAMLAMLASNNCLITDRPDLPRADDTCWTTDFSKEIEAVDEAICILSGLGGWNS
jgi:hypothetical protein